MENGSTHSTINRMAFIGNYLPRQCGIATFTTDLCEAIAAEYGDTTCIALPVNDIEKDAAMFPHRIGGHWALIHRPVSAPRAHMWISYSPDLRHWGSHNLMLEARRGAWWDANKIGLSPPPIETPRAGM
jgi:predicted GH43/DUF377 family glycosyl hydrolase